jgi:putative SOS response-associated peptidase YedK
MCGRFTLTVSADELARQFRTAKPTIDSVAPNYNVSPTTPIYFIKGEDESGTQRCLQIAKWGLIPAWSKDASRASNAINARVESIAEKPSFREAFKSRRALIPVTGYYEWATELGPYPPKQPFYIHNADQSPLAIAGLYEYWVNPVNGESVTTASIITRESVGQLATIHHRMPVILPKERWSQWLSSKSITTKEEEVTLKLLDLANPEAGLSFHPVSACVNSAMNSGSDLPEPIVLGEPETLF